MARILLARYHRWPCTLEDYRRALYNAATVIYAVESPASLAIPYHGAVYVDTEAE